MKVIIALLTIICAGMTLSCQKTKTNQFAEQEIEVYQIILDGKPNYSVEKLKL